MGRMQGLPGAWQWPEGAPGGIAVTGKQGAPAHAIGHVVGRKRPLRVSGSNPQHREYVMLHGGGWAGGRYS